MAAKNYLPIIEGDNTLLLTKSIITTHNIQHGDIILLLQTNGKFQAKIHKNTK